MASDGSPIGSVGNLVAAAMETAGHHVQSLMLDAMQQGFGYSLAALLIIISAMGALFIIGIGGHYKFGLWFLIGPWLYLMVISTRVTSGGAKYKLGYRAEDQAAVSAAVTGVALPEVYGRRPTGKEVVGRVSLVFAVWDDFTSRVINSLVIVLRPRPAADQEFVSKTERYETLFHLRITDPQLKAWLQTVMIQPCQPYFLALKASLTPVHNNITKEELANQVNQGAAVRVNITSQPKLYNWLQSDALAAPIWNAWKAQNKVSDAAPELSCAQLWDVSSRFAANHAEKLIENLINSSTGPDLSAHDIKARFLQKIRSTANIGGETRQLTDSEKAMVLFNEVGGRLILQELAEIAPGARLRTKTPRQVMERALKNFEEDPARDIRAISATDEYQGKGDFLSAMLSLPYVQGLLLYALSFSFPFFALALVIPGRHHTLLMWMGLWFWVKSWDFGVAIVMYVDELLYALLPHSPLEVAASTFIRPGNPQQANELAANTIKALLEVDPTYSIHTYYTLIATLILAVPAVTAVLCKKGGGEVLDAVQQGFHNFSGKIGGAMTAYASSLRAQTLAAESRADVRMAAENALLKSLSDPEVLQTFGRSFAVQQYARYQKSRRTGGGGTDVFNDLFQDMSKVSGGQDKKIALAKIKFNMETAAYQQSLSDENQRRAADAVLQRYYSHDFSMSPPGGSAMEVLKNYYNFPIGSNMTTNMRKTMQKGAGGLGNAAAKYFGR